MSSEVRDFLSVDKGPVVDMTLEELHSEVEGWRMVTAMLPLDIYQWLARMHEVVRLTQRNYNGHLGVLLGVKFEVTEYTLGLRETAFDPLRGRRMVEDKVLTIPANAVLFFEAIEDQTDYDPADEDAALAKQELRL